MIADFSVGSVFLLLAGLHILLLLFIRFIPDSGEIEQMPEVKATGSVPVLVALGFVLIFKDSFELVYQGNCFIKESFDFMGNFITCS